MGGNCSSPTVVVLHSYSATMDRGKQDKRSIGHPNIHLKLRNSISTDRPSQRSHSCSSCTKRPATSPRTSAARLANRSFRTFHAFELRLNTKAAGKRRVTRVTQ